MKVPKISVIVPVFKVEEYLQECIDSILKQTFTDFELILVNDGSPDNCGRICDFNASKDSRIRVIHQNNQGATRARANGVAAANGEFITFVDGDDTLLPHALEFLLSYQTDGIDIVMGKYQTNTIPSAGVISAEKYREMCVTLKNTFGGPCAKLFKRYLFDDTTFDIPRDILIGEDTIMNIHIAYALRGSVYSTDSQIYTYRKNLNSAMHNHMTPDVIARYQRGRLQAVPAQDIEKYLPLGLADSLIGYWNAATYQLIRIPESVHQEHDFLISILKHSHIKFDFLSRLFFCSRNPATRFSIKCIRKLLRMLKIYK